jgi:branched-chain amino acid transport system permease protein
MDFAIATLLVQDGLTSGAIYALLALALVLVFAVTRIIFIPQGEFVAYGALTLATLQQKAVPWTATMLVCLSVLTAVLDVRQALLGWRRGVHPGRPLWRSTLTTLVLSAVVYGLTRVLATRDIPMVVQLGLTLLMVVPMGPLLYRLAYQPLANASVLVLLIVSVSVHLAMAGLGLVMFGAEGSRTQPLTEARFELGVLTVSGQSMVVIFTVMLLIITLYCLFERTLTGKALRATAINRRGARLVGISVQQAGRLACTLAAGIGALCGVLVSPITTIYYDSGFLIGLKGFVGAIVGGLASYPLAAAGAVLVGLLESVSSFWASALKEVIAFTILIPVLLWLSCTQPHSEDEE